MVTLEGVCTGERLFRRTISPEGSCPGGRLSQKMVSPEGGCPGGRLSRKTGPGGNENVAYRHLFELVDPLCFRCLLTVPQRAPALCNAGMQIG